MVEYKLNCEENSYGIDAIKNGITVKSINCITDEIGDANSLVDLLNNLKIELCHFEDIIEDYLTDFRI